jgi:hypothetical protein
MTWFGFTYSLTGELTSNRNESNRIYRAAAKLPSLHAIAIEVKRRCPKSPPRDMEKPLLYSAVDIKMAWVSIEGSRVSTPRGGSCPLWILADRSFVWASRHQDCHLLSISSDRSSVWARLMFESGCSQSLYSLSVPSLFVVGLTWLLFWGEFLNLTFVFFFFF